MSNEIVEKRFVGIAFDKGFATVEQVLAEASTWFTMEPGDCIHTGTAVKGTENHPRGNLGVDLREYSVTDVEIDGLGRLSNPIKAEPA